MSSVLIGQILNLKIFIILQLQSMCPKQHTFYI